ncbi:MAG: polysaccharide biosynthesis/export family protein [Planctomycetaceae bacterium]|nr:polysaccharide biosynthesis/export family protein [Planctomycetaceae bacterium]
MRRNFPLLIGILFFLPGCVQTQFSAGSLPARLAARPIQDYSGLNLAAYTSARQSTDLIHPGDRLEVSLDPGTLDDKSVLNWKVTVDEFGETSLPNIGPVKLAGLSSAEAEKAIIRTSLERDVFLTPVVDVDVRERRPRRVLVTGAVGTPGAIEIPDDSVSLADILVRAGGLTAEATGTISVNGARSVPDDNADDPPANALRAISSSAVTATTISLESTPESELGEIMVSEGAVVHAVAHSPRPIQVVGVIRNKAIEVAGGQNVRLLDALTEAGGQTYSNWISDKVTIVRQNPDGSGTFRIKASIRKAKADARENILLAPYDIVSVEENVVTFTLSTLSGLFGAAMNASRIGI